MEFFCMAVFRIFLAVSAISTDTRFTKKYNRNELFLVKVWANLHKYLG